MNYSNKLVSHVAHLTLFCNMQLYMCDVTSTHTSLALYTERHVSN